MCVQYDEWRCFYVYHRNHCSHRFIDFSFEQFAAKRFEELVVASPHVLPPSGDHGVDFEHIINDQLYLGHVKCYRKDLPYVPIALLHLI